MTRTLQEVAQIAAGCIKCRLAQGRTQVVFGVGSPTADLMFVGEGPGFHEDRQGIPFVGAAGQLLTRLLSEVGLSREEVYIANVVKCLRYSSQVQLGDGSWDRIGRLVRSRYAGTVMSVDSEGRLVRRRVIGWHASPLAGRRVLRLTYRAAKNAGNGRVGVELTGDHPVLTDQGWVAADRLVPGSRVATGQGLSAVARDVVCGTILGDGHISAHSAHLSFGHSSRQRDYAVFKADLLAELHPRVQEFSVAAVSGGPKVHPTVHVRTLAHRALGILRRDFYAARKGVPKWMATGLTERMLAIWFMDDGYTRIRKGRQPVSEIATCAFSDQDLTILREGLLSLGIRATSARARLFFDAEATKILSIRIAPFTPPSMRYKLHPEVASWIPFDPTRLRRGPAEALYDQVEIEDVTEHPRTDTTFFCIDVEETHNFVTAGGVVHNCRPPGNRDPLPDEIESCKPYLLEQVALIDPHLIVTLGNFATRVILDRPVSISRVRGQRFRWDGRLVIPTFHPAAILHGGGESSQQMARIREDFQAIRAALAEVPEPVEEQLGLF
jgi:uracil-DNA glycosylase family 4